MELKTGCETDIITEKDLNPLGGSVRWNRGTTRREAIAGDRSPEPPSP
ncbi:hypothetical protein ACFRCG_29520 [Embleya sp. NPDC056575]